MRDLPLADLHRCAGCHDQCQFATTEVFASGSMALDTSRKALLLLALSAGRLEMSERAVEVVYSGLSSGVQHSVCVYRGDPEGWPDETEWLRAARADIVLLGRAPAWATEVRDSIMGAAGSANSRSSRSQLVQLRGSISTAADPDGHAQLSSIASSRGLDLGVIDGEAGFELYDLGFIDDARSIASELASRLDGMAAEVVISDAPEAVWMMRKVWPTWGIQVNAQVVHESTWLDDLDIRGDRDLPGAVGYHDPAFLVRGLGVADAPRRVLERLGARLLEFLRYGDETLPAGGFYGTAQARWIASLADERLASATRLGMNGVVVASPYDLRSLAGHQIPVRTLHAVVASASA